MKMVDMKCDDSDEKDESQGMVMADDKPAYPWGLQIRLDDDCMEKLALPELPKAGTKLMLHAMVDVVETGEQVCQDGEKARTMSLQITEMALDKAMESMSPEKVLYKR